MRRGNPPKPGAADIELVSGDYLNLHNPDPSVITVEVIAHHLANVCRYAGATKRFYSVLEHSLVVARRLEDFQYGPEVILSGLHHDDAEAFVHDVTRPLKELLPDYRAVEERIAKAVGKALSFEHLGVDIENPVVKEADHWALSAEAYHLMASKGRDWWCEGLYDHTEGISLLFEPGTPPQDLVDIWLWSHHRLCRAIRALKVA